MASDELLVAAVNAITRKDIPTEEKTIAYIEISNRLKVITCTGKVPDIVYEFRHSLIGSVTNGITNTDTSYSLQSLQMAGYILFNKLMSKSFSDKEIADIINVILKVIRDPMCTKQKCIRALWCLSNQNIDQSTIKHHVKDVLEILRGLRSSQLMSISCVASEIVSVLCKFYSQCKDKFIDLKILWYDPLVHIMVGKHAKIKQKALVLANELEDQLKVDAEVCSWLHQELKTKNLVSHMAEMFASKWKCDTVILLKIWQHFIFLLGKNFHKSGTFINEMLKIVEKGFKHQTMSVQLEAYYSWNVLIDNFSLDPNILTNKKRIKLLLLPLINSAAKIRYDEVDQSRLNTWWYLITHLLPHLTSSNKELFYNHVFATFLIFCLNLDPSSFSNIQVISSPKEFLQTLTSKLSPNLFYSFNPTSSFVCTSCLAMLLLLGVDDVKVDDALITTSSLNMSKNEVYSLDVLFVFLVYLEGLLWHGQLVPPDVLKLVIFHILSTTMSSLKIIGPCPSVYQMLSCLIRIFARVELQDSQKIDILCSFSKLPASLLSSDKAHESMLVAWNYYLSTAFTLLLDENVNMDGRDLFPFCKHLFFMVPMITSPRGPNQFDLEDQLTTYHEIIDIMTDCCSTINSSINYGNLGELWSLLSAQFDDFITTSVKFNTIKKENFHIVKIFLKLPFAYELVKHGCKISNIFNSWKSLFTSLCTHVVKDDCSLLTEMLAGDLFTIETPMKLSKASELDSHLSFSCTILQLMLNHFLQFNSKSTQLQSCYVSIATVMKQLLDEFNEYFSEHSQEFSIELENLNSTHYFLSIFQAIYEFLVSSEMVLKATTLLALPLSTFIKMILEEKRNKRDQQLLVLSNSIVNVWKAICTCFKSNYEDEYSSNVLNVLSPLIEVSLLYGDQAIFKETLTFWSGTFGKVEAPLEYSANLRVTLTGFRSQLFNRLSLPGLHDVDEQQSALSSEVSSNLSDSSNLEAEFNNLIPNVPSSGNESTSSPVPDTTNPIEPNKTNRRKRGRPRKFGNSEVLVSDTTSPIEPNRRKRGRPSNSEVIAKRAKVQSNSGSNQRKKLLKCKKFASLPVSKLVSISDVSVSISLVNTSPVNTSPVNMSPVNMSPVNISLVNTSPVNTSPVNTLADTAVNTSIDTPIDIPSLNQQSSLINITTDNNVATADINIVTIPIATDIATVAGTDSVTTAGTDIVTTAGSDIVTDIITTAGTDIVTTAGTDIVTTASTDIVTTAGTDIVTDIITTAGTDIVTTAGTDIVTTASTDIVTIAGTDIVTDTVTACTTTVTTPIPTMATTLPTTVTVCTANATSITSAIDITTASTTTITTTSFSNCQSSTTPCSSNKSNVIQSGNGSLQKPPINNPNYVLLSSPSFNPTNRIQLLALWNQALTTASHARLLQAKTTPQVSNILALLSNGTFQSPVLPSNIAQALVKQTTPVSSADISQVPVDISQAPDPPADIPQVPVDISQAPDPPADIPQVPVDISQAPDPPADIPQVPVDISQAPDPPADISQVPVDISHAPDPPADISQIPVDISHAPDPLVNNSQAPDPPADISHVSDPPVNISQVPDPLAVISQVPDPPVNISHAPDPPADISQVPDPLADISHVPDPPVGISQVPDPPAVISQVPDPPVNISQDSDPPSQGKSLNNISHDYLHTVQGSVSSGSLSEMSENIEKLKLLIQVPSADTAESPLNTNDNVNQSSSPNINTDQHHCSYPVQKLSTLSKIALISYSNDNNKMPNTPPADNLNDTKGNSTTPVGILKHISQFDSPLSNKIRHVQFAEPVAVVECEAPLLIHKEPRVTKSNHSTKRKSHFSSRRTLQLNSSPTPTSNPSNTSTSPSTPSGPVFPSLVSCESPVEDILPSLTPSGRYTHGLYNVIHAKNITTVGSLSSLSEHEVSSLPIRSPKVTVLRTALRNFENRMQGQTQKRKLLRDNVESSESNIQKKLKFSSPDEVYTDESQLDDLEEHPLITLCTPTSQCTAPEDVSKQDSVMHDHSYTSKVKTSSDHSLTTSSSSSSSDIHDNNKIYVEDLGPIDGDVLTDGGSQELFPEEIPMEVVSGGNVDSGISDVDGSSATTLEATEEKKDEEECHDIIERDTNAVEGESIIDMTLTCIEGTADDVEEMSYSKDEENTTNEMNEDDNVNAVTSSSEAAAINPNVDLTNNGCLQRNQMILNVRENVKLLIENMATSTLEQTKDLHELITDCHSLIHAYLNHMHSNL